MPGRRLGKDAVALTAKPMILSKRSARVVDQPWTWVARSSIAVASGSMRGFGRWPGWRRKSTWGRVSPANAGPGHQWRQQTGDG
jgi:hypothetical protein